MEKFNRLLRWSGLVGIILLFASFPSVAMATDSNSVKIVGHSGGDDTHFTIGHSAGNAGFSIGWSPTWWDEDWEYRNVLSFKASTISENLTDFPVKVTLSASNFDFSKAKSNGEDVRFVDEDDTTSLPYEFEWWDSTNETAVAWVQIPQIDAGADYTDYFYIYYGNAAASDAQDKNAVWAGTGAVGVWHLGSDNSSAGVAYDSTSNAIDGIVTGAVWSRDGRTFDGTNKIVSGVSPVSLTNNATLLVWLKSSNIVVVRSVLTYGATTAGGITINLNQSLHSSGEGYLNNGGWCQSNIVANAAPNGTWVFLHLTYNNVTFRMGTNDNFPAGAAVSGNITQQINPLASIGSSVSGSEAFAGIISEAFLYNRALSNNEITAAYMNQIDTLLYYGGEDPPPSVTTLPGSYHTASSHTYDATLNGSLDDLGGSPSCDIWFEWGYDTGYGNTAGSQTVGSTGSYSVAVQDMDAGTTVHFRFAGENVDGTTYGDDENFYVPYYSESYTGLTPILKASPLIVLIAFLVGGVLLFFLGAKQQNPLYFGIGMALIGVGFILYQVVVNAIDNIL